MSKEILNILTVAYGGYQSWAKVSSKFTGDTEIFGDRLYHLHAPIHASTKAAKTLGCNEGDWICGVRWSDSLDTLMEDYHAKYSG